MNHDHDPIDRDPVWDLLRRAPRRDAGPRFVDDVVRAARVAQHEEPWWKRFRLPLAVGGLTTAATAAIAAALLLQAPPAPPAEVVTGPSSPESMAELDDYVRTEALIVAAENPSEYSDAELVSLISY